MIALHVLPFMAFIQPVFPKQEPCFGQSSRGRGDWRQAWAGLAIHGQAGGVLPWTGERYESAGPLPHGIAA
jgi:hypothetical protein